MKPLIIAIVGASGSGKTYMTKFLQNELNIPAIISHTTRPMREGETEGKDYFFIESTEGYTRDQMLTYTKFGQYEYFALLSQIPPGGICSYVVEENGLQELIEHSNDRYEVYAVSVYATAFTRMMRGIFDHRIKRDANRRELPRLLFDAFITNDGTTAEFEWKILNETKILEIWRDRK